MKVWATSTFGTNDKTALLVGVFVVVFVYAMVVGVLAARRLAYGFAGLALFAVLGIAAAVTRHGASPGYALPTVFGALVGAFALYRLIGSAEAIERGARRAAATTRGRTGDRGAAADRLRRRRPSADDDDDKADAGAARGRGQAGRRAARAGPAARLVRVRRDRADSDPDPGSTRSDSGSDAGAAGAPVRPTPRGRPRCGRPRTGQRGRPAAGPAAAGRSW